MEGTRIAFSWAVLALISACAATKLPSDAPCVQHKGSCYIIGEKPVCWKDAQKVCQVNDGHLTYAKDASTSDRLMAFVNEHVKSLGVNCGQATHGYWIGMSDVKREGSWRWVKPHDTKLAYQAWGVGEPNNAQGNEDCGTFKVTSYNVHWNDYFCTSKLPYICEVANSTCPAGSFVYEAVSSWDCEKVSVWLAKHDLELLANSFNGGLDGKLLIELRKMYKVAPDTFYNRLQHEFGADFFSTLKLTRTLTYDCRLVA